MSERELLLIPGPTMMQPEVLAREFRQAIIATAEVLQEIGSPADRDTALSPLEELPA
jgi:aspartate aminotransferase-like enzyme